MSDYNDLRKFLLDSVHVRGELVRLTSSVDEICHIHHYPPVIQTYLQQLCAAATMLTGLLKFKGILTLQINTQGSLQYLVCKCNHLLEFRALASWDREALPADFEKDILSGTLVVTIQHDANPKPYQGIIPLNHHSIMHGLESYFSQSEQLETKLLIATKANAVAGMLLQKLPQFDAEQNQIWLELIEVVNDISHDDLHQLEAIALLEQYFAHLDVRVFEPKPAQFKCTCTVDKMAEAIKLMGQEEALEILQTKREIEVTCEFCNQAYCFGAMEVKKLFGQDEAK